MKIIILGADGYLGWPMSVDLALDKHNLMLVDNYIKRSLMKKLGRNPIKNLPKLEVRIKKLKRFNKNIRFSKTDCSNLKEFSTLFRKFKPDAVIHFAELPSAPFSMMGSSEGWFTLENNLKSTFNLAHCVRKYNPSCHIIKLGTMGEYGTPNIDIEEGWLKVLHNKRKQKFLYPRQASSLYHTSKIMDTDLLWFYVRTHGIKVTDLMQGPVYGINTNSITEEYNLHPLFTYDDIFGTVLNRFIVQAVAKMPLSIYGSGNQVRGYINIKDTINCIKLALKNEPKQGELNIYNQFTEQFSVNELAKNIISSLNEIDIFATTKKISNPRIEKEKHYYNAKNINMKKLGLKPTKLSKKIIIEMAQYVIKNKKNTARNDIVSPRKTTEKKNVKNGLNKST